MATYKSSYTGPQIDQAVSHAVNMDVNPTAGHTDRVVSSGGVKSALTTNTISTGTTGLYAKKCVSIVMLTSGDTSRVTADANETIWTLPASLRPLEYVEFLNVVNQERLVITPTGMIRSTVALDNVLLRFTVTYLT